MSDNNNDNWAIVELMGHVALAGRVTKPGEYGGLWQIDVPDGETFRTEFFGSQSVYRIRMVSEAIARAYARPSHDIIAYDAPIITREEHEVAMERAREINNDLRKQLYEAEKKLLALPTGLPVGLPTSLTASEAQAGTQVGTQTDQSSEAIPGVADEIDELWEEDIEGESHDTRE